jgi:isopenicillin-N N-acyltransferase like protein
VIHGRVIELRGSPRERGRRYGTSAIAAIRRTARATYDSLHALGRPLDAIRDDAAAFGESVERHAPELLDEMTGVAEGTGLEIADILAINCRYELMWPPHGVASTALAAVPPAAPSVLLAQNADVLPDFQANQFVLVIEDEPAGDIMMVAEAGFVGGFGLNRSGVGVCGTVLAAGSCRPGLPFRLLLRQVLRAPNLRAAERTVVSAPRAYSAYYLIGSSDEGAVGIECTREGSSSLRPANGLLAHANHFLSRLDTTDEGLLLWPDSTQRTARANHLAAERAPLGVRELQAILRDHHGFPQSICRHASTPGSLEVLVSLVMDLDARTMWMTWGPPCRGDYELGRFRVSRPEDVS